MKKGDKGILNLTLCIIIIIAAVFLIKLLYDIFFTNTLYKFREIGPIFEAMTDSLNTLNNSAKMNNNTQSMLSKVFINKKGNIYTNNGYKDGIMKGSIQQPNDMKGIRVNFYTAGESMLM